MSQERKPPFDFKAVPKDNFMAIKIKKTFFKGVKKGEEGEDDYTWYAWTFETLKGLEEIAFTPEKLHQLFVKLGFRAGTEFGLKRIAVISEESDRSNLSFAVRYNGREYQADSNGEPENLPEEGREIPVNKEDLLKQESQEKPTTPSVDLWCEHKENLYKRIMNAVLDAEIDRFGARFESLLEDDQQRLKLEIELLANARPTINTLLMSFDETGGKV